MARDQTIVTKFVNSYVLSPGCQVHGIEPCTGVQGVSLWLAEGAVILEGG